MSAVCHSSWMTARPPCLVPVRDADAMANAALAILTYPQLSRRLAEAGMLHVQQFAWSHVRAGWLDVYRRLLGEAPARSGTMRTTP